MYTSAKQIPDYRWLRITFTYGIHLPLHIGTYPILVVVETDSDTPYREIDKRKNARKEREKEREREKAVL